SFLQNIKSQPNEEVTEIAHGTTWPQFLCHIPRIYRRIGRLDVQLDPKQGSAILHFLHRQASSLHFDLFSTPTKESRSGQKDIERHTFVRSQVADKRADTELS